MKKPVIKLYYMDEFESWSNKEAKSLVYKIAELQKQKEEIERKLEESRKRISELEKELKSCEFGMFQDLGR